MPCGPLYCSYLYEKLERVSGGALCEGVPIFPFLLFCSPRQKLIIPLGDPAIAFCSTVINKD